MALVVRRPSPRLPMLPWTAMLAMKLRYLEREVETLQNEALELLAQNEAALRHLREEWREAVRDAFFTHAHALSMQREIRNRDRTIAGLVQIVEDQRAAIGQLMGDRVTCGEEEASVFVCECCFSSDVARENRVRCEASERAHALCLKCVDQMCALLLEKTEAPPARVPCPAPDCTGTLAAADVCKTVEGRRLMRERHVHDFLPVVANMLGPGGVGPDARLDYLPFMTADGSSRALACPQCSYGPLLHAHCDDLHTHHGQAAEGDATVSNACPRCGHLAAERGGLVRWRIRGRSPPYNPP